MHNLHFENPYDELKNPKKIIGTSELIIDGYTHQALDKSFNNSAYLGLVNWI
jgi:hypothetical protein